MVTVLYYHNIYKKSISIGETTLTPGAYALYPGSS